MSLWPVGPLVRDRGAHLRVGPGGRAADTAQPAVVVRHREVSAARGDSATAGWSLTCPEQSSGCLAKTESRTGPPSPHRTGTSMVSGEAEVKAVGQEPQQPRPLLSRALQTPGQGVRISPSNMAPQEGAVGVAPRPRGREAEGFFLSAHKHLELGALGFFFLPPNSPCPGPRVPGEARDGRNDRPPPMTTGSAWRRPSAVSDPQPAACPSREWGWGPVAGRTPHTPGSGGLQTPWGLQQRL